LRTKLEPLGLIPLTRKDIHNVLVNPFLERYGPILEFAKSEVGLNNKETRELVEEVAVKCLAIGCKVCQVLDYINPHNLCPVIPTTLSKSQGRMLRKLLEGFPFLHDTISLVVTQRYHLALDDLPPYEDEKACAAYEAKLCRDYIASKLVDTPAFAGEDDQEDDEDDEEEAAHDHEVTAKSGDDAPELVCDLIVGLPSHCLRS
jgi:hypothetical protein